MKHNFNPILPLNEYIPDGEPHIFGDRIYLFGSHDQEGGTRYCAEANYMGWSAPVSDPTDWTCSGVIYEPSQDPNYTPEDNAQLYAPDVMQGPDGRFYLYYCFGGTAGHDRIGVAVCDSPDGHYAYYGQVQNPDGSCCKEYLMGDPGVINDDGVPRLYCGWSLSMKAAAAHSRGKGTDNTDQNKLRNGNASGMQRRPQLPEPGDPDMNRKLAPVYRMMFHREQEQVEHLEFPLMGANAYTLCDDMVTIKEGPFRIVPGQFDTPSDSSFYGHAFYEASSIRKINGKYYFIYSSENSNELCYAVSNHPYRDFVYGGTIISNGDVGYLGRADRNRTNQTANNHGSLECINGQWYIFYHRQTHRSAFSRQACAEPVTILSDGSIPQVECSSMGLHAGPLPAAGTYPASICCVLTNGNMPHITNTRLEEDIPYITHGDGGQYITGIKQGVTIGYKYFDFKEPVCLNLSLRGYGEGLIRAYVVKRDIAVMSENQVPELACACAEAALPESKMTSAGSESQKSISKRSSTSFLTLPACGEAAIPKCEKAISDKISTVYLPLPACGEAALYLVYEGEGSAELFELSFL